MLLAVAGWGPNLTGFRKFHDALTATTSIARTPALLKQLQKGETLEFKEWPAGVSSAFMVDFGSMMNVLGPKATSVIHLTRDKLIAGNQTIELSAIANFEIPDTCKTPTLSLHTQDGSTIAKLRYQRVIDFPLLMALIEALMENNDFRI